MTALATRITATVLTAAVLSLCVAAAIALSRSDQAAIDAYGLLPALPVLYLIALAAAVGSFFVLLSLPARSELLLAHLVAVVFLLDAAPALLESEPRFVVAWLHAGFTDQIATHGEVLEGYDARMSWPAFFAASALAVVGAQAGDAITLLRWTPLALHLLYLAPLGLIARSLTADRRVRWTGLLLFYLADWVGQAYFSPQGAAYLLFLTVVAILVTYFRVTSSHGHRLLRRVHRLMDRVGPEPSADSPVGLRAQLLLFGVVVLLTLALMPTHQLMPVALALVAGALLLTGRLGLTTFPVLVGLALIGYIAFGATDYWLGHRAELFTGGGQDAVSANLAERVSGSPEHLLVLRVRLVVTALLFTVAAVGVLRQLRRRQVSLPLLALALGAFPLPVFQAYGGEALLRVVFYSLPFVALLAGSAFFRGRDPFARQTALAASFCIVLAMAYPLARYGNESFESFTTNEVETVRALYDAAPPGSTFVAPLDVVPWRTERLRGYDYVIVPADVDRTDPFAVLNMLDDLPNPVYVVLTRAQEAWGIENYGYPGTWMSDLAAALLDDPEYLRIRNEPGAVVFVREDRRDGGTAGEGAP